MIRRVTDIIPTFSDSWYGKKISAYISAYGVNYDFCRLFEADSGGKILLYNSTMTCDGKFETSELESFVSMTNPITIEASCTRLNLDKSYNSYRKTLFKGISRENEIDVALVKKNTSLDDIYRILEDSFGITEYDAWYADTSHRIRHGVSDVFLYGSTTVTKLFDVNGFVFLSHIATGEADRGKGTARNLLWHICGEFEKQGKSVYLYAKDERVSFYEGIGFEPVSEEIFYEKEF